MGPDGSMEHETPLRLLHAQVEAHPQSIFVRTRNEDGETTLSYGDAAQRAAAFAERVLALGVTPGSTLVMFEEGDLLQFLLVELAAMLAAAVVIPLAPRFSAERLAAVMRRVDGRAVLCHREHAAKPLSKGLPVWILPGGGEAPPGCESLEVPATAPEGALDQLRARSAESSPRDVVLLMPTSGTTGEPKLVIKNAFALLRASRLLAHRFPAGEQPRFLLASPLTHLVGQGIVMHALRTGGQLCIPSRIEGDCPLSDVLAFDPSVVVTTPRVLLSLHRQHRESGAAGESFLGRSTKFVMTMGNAAPPDLVRPLLQSGIDVADSYGTTETGLLAASPPGGRMDGVVGRACEDTSVWVADDGELVVSVPEECDVSYFPGTAPAPALDESGAYHTGDFGSVDGDGNIRILGRKSDLFNTIDGSNISPMHTEVLIDALPWVSQVALIGDGRPFIVALVVLSSPPAGSEGVVDPARHPELYATARRDLGRINSCLEDIEKVRRVALLASPMPGEHYQMVAAGKVKRDRPALIAHYRADVDAMYAAPTDGSNRLDDIPGSHVA